MSTEHTYSSIRIPLDLVTAVDDLVQEMNERAGAKVWSRNKLILKAIRDYYFSTVDIPIERRTFIRPVDNDQRTGGDRRLKRPVTCAEVHLENRSGNQEGQRAAGEG